MTEKQQYFAERLTALFNDPDLSIADEIMAESFKSHVPLAPEVDREGWKAYVQNFLNGFPDLHMEVHETITTSNRAILRVTYRGTQTGEFLGVAPSGKKIEMPAVGWFHLDQDGKAVENWGVFDVMGVMQAIGAIPAPG